MARASRKVPAECSRYAGLPAGVGVPCESAYIGRHVHLRDGSVEIVGCATPVRATGARSGTKRNRCQRAFLVKSSLGIAFAIPAGQVREKLRARNADVDPGEPFPRGVGYLAQQRRELAKVGEPLYQGGELPYRHRRASTACCVNSPRHPDRLSALVREVESGESFLDAADVVAVVRGALPRAMASVKGETRTLADVPKAITSLRRYCWEQLEAWDRKGLAKQPGGAAWEVAQRKRSLAKERTSEALGTSVGSGSYEQDYREGLASVLNASARKHGVTRHRTG